MNRWVYILLALVMASLEAAEGGTLTGKVTWEGEIPKVMLLDITQNAEIQKACACTPDEKAKASPRLVVDEASRGVKFTVVSVEGVPADKAKPFPKREVIINQKFCEFLPHVVWIEVDTAIKFKNSDATLHNVHGKTEAGSVFNTSMPVKDQVIGKTLREPGIIALSCDVGHPWMSAYIFVTSHPYIAITDEQGKFSMDGIPAGTYTVKFWHAGWAAAPEKEHGDPVAHTVEVQIKPGETMEAHALLTETGFKK